MQEPRLSSVSIVWHMAAPILRNRGPPKDGRENSALLN